MKKIVTCIAFLLFLLPYFSYSQVWRPLPGTGGGTDGEVLSLYHDTACLWITGHFTHAGGLSVQNIVRHDGTRYIPTVGFTGDCYQCIKWKGKIYACGRFSVGTSNYGLMRFDTTTWTPLMKFNDNYSYVHAMAVYNNKLVLGGYFSSTVDLSDVGLAQYDGTHWSAILTSEQIQSSGPAIYVLYVDGSNLYVGGAFTSIAVTVTPTYTQKSKCVIWNGATWSSLAVDYANQYQVHSIFRNQNTIWAAGYLRGFFCCPYTNSGAIDACDGITYGLASGWNGWNYVIHGVGIDVLAATAFNGLIYAGGTTNGLDYSYNTNRLWTWNGATWNKDPQFEQLGVPALVSVMAMAKNPAGTILYLGGRFTVNGGYNLVYTGAINALPVTLTSFTGTCTDAGPSLRWETASEINNDHFEIQYSDDAEHFVSVGQMAGYGTTTQPHQYSWTDSVNHGGYYRLIQYDHNGESTPSTIVSVGVCAQNKMSLDIFPTCVSDILTVKTNSDALGMRYHICDMHARVVRTWCSSENNQSIDLSDLASGMYIVVMYDTSGYRESKKFFKL